MYDKTTRAFVEIDSISGIIYSDTNLDFKILSSDTYYEDYNSGKDKHIFIDNIVFVPSIINYYSNNTSCKGNILPREILLDIDVDDKIYDGTKNININIKNINNIIHDDSVYLRSLNSSFDDSNVGDNKIITINNVKIYGPSSDNYICNDFTFFGNIKPKYIDINFTAEDQEYNENLTPKLIYNEQIASYTAQYKQINVGSQEIIITNITLSDSINYIVNDQLISGVITPKRLYINFKAEDKIYDGSNNVLVSHNSNLLTSYDAIFEDPNCGYKKVFVNNIKLVNENYITDTSVIIYANILPQELFINPVILKIYDGTPYYVTTMNVLFAQSNVGKNIKVNISNVKLSDTNYIVKDFETIGNIEPKMINPEFIIEDKIYDGTNKVIIKKIVSEVDIKSYNAYYIDINSGKQQVIIDNIVFYNFNYVAEPIYLDSYIKPLPLEIEFIVKSKVYDDTNNALIESYKILNCNANIDISYNATYENINVGKQKVIINIESSYDNYITKTYVAYGIIKPVLLKITYSNENKVYDGTNISNLLIENNNNVKVNFKSIYTNNIINVFDIELDNSNYYLNNFTVIGNILPKEITCIFKFINNMIVGNLIGVINKDDVWINNYISYVKDGETYIQSITLGGNAKNNYKIINNIYKVLSN
jgi:hypothetical protein